MPRRTTDVDQVIAAALAGSARAVARLITLVENADPALPTIAARLAGHAGGAHIIGLTGAPGVGKSTTTSALVAAYRGRGLRVAVLAVDPSSPFSGGALLGDRIRLAEHSLDRNVYMRSMASRGHLGGLSWATPQALRVLDAAGFEVILLETVGVGQSEVEVAGLADTTVVLTAPGMGDGIQAAKAGILEVADIFVVNKADREGVQSSVRDLRSMISLGPPREPGDWRPEVLTSIADRGEGIDEVLAALDKHWAWLSAPRGAGSELQDRRIRRARREIEEIALASLRAQLDQRRGGSDLDGLAEAVVAGEIDPYTAAATAEASLPGVPSP